MFFAVNFPGHKIVKGVLESGTAVSPHRLTDLLVVEPVVQIEVFFDGAVAGTVMETVGQTQIKGRDVKIKTVFDRYRFTAFGDGAGFSGPEEADTGIFFQKFGNGEGGPFEIFFIVAPDENAFVVSKSCDKLFFISGNGVFYSGCFKADIDTRLAEISFFELNHLIFFGKNLAQQLTHFRCRTGVDPVVVDVCRLFAQFKGTR